MADELAPLSELPAVICDTHGPMKWRNDVMWWVCPGFDGEGCSVQLVYREDVRCYPPYDPQIPGVTVTYG